ncbi:hypothetical protein AVEN_108459-1 [Araneus ventricosus]|uniref:ATP-dependent DNA helicase n=1 Tax=Araneus ventricosus TaxID=182803 RepID=A0A4Y2J8U3_ARAVE|nr:hypothetical protein AVEN_108459-1 [Araneus ventricosus]
MAVVEINNATTGANLEIARYQMGRYIDSNEVVSRILHFIIHDRYPTDVHLSLHLEIGQRVYFIQDNAHERATQPPDTTLGLSVPTRQAHHTLDTDLLRETDYDINILRNIVETNKPRLTEDQRTAYEAGINLIAEGNGCILYLDAPGGTGKTLTTNLILAEIGSKPHIALAVASSG